MGLFRKISKRLLGIQEDKIEPITTVAPDTSIKYEPLKIMNADTRVSMYHGIRVCNILYCMRKHYGRGLCKPHYYQQPEWRQYHAALMRKRREKK